MDCRVGPGLECGWGVGGGVQRVRGVCGGAMGGKVRNGVQVECRGGIGWVFGGSGVGVQGMRGSGVKCT